MKIASGLLCALLALAVPSAAGNGAAPDTELRCGWFDNPTPGNATLLDRDGEWTLAIQGGHQAKGPWPPQFPEAQWVRTGAGSSGYGCACLRVRVDRARKTVIEVASSTARPLTVCRTDRALKEPQNPLR